MANLNDHREGRATGKGLGLLALLCVAVALYAGLAVLFYSEEHGFSWFFSFSALSGIVLALFSAAIYWEAKRSRASRGSEPTPPDSGDEIGRRG